MDDEPQAGWPDPYMQAIFNALEDAVSILGMVQSVEIKPRGALGLLKGRHPTEGQLALRLERSGLTRTVTARFTAVTLDGGIRLRTIGTASFPCQYLTTAPPPGLVKTIQGWLGSLPKP